MPGEQIFFDILYGFGKLWSNLEHGTFTDVAVGLTVLVHMYEVVAPFLCVGSIDACPFHRLGVEQHGMSATCLHEQRLVGTDLIKIGLADIFLIFHPSCSYVEIALRILLNECLDDVTIPCIVGSHSSLHQVRLSDSAFSGKATVTVGLHKARIDVVVTIVQHLCIGTGEFLRFLCAADIGKYTVLY